MNFKIIDLFAGIGGIRLGIENAIYKNGDTSKCVFSSEIDKYAIQTYITNFGKTNFYGDITNLKDDKNIKKIIPDFDILLAGFPCQPFSQAGLKKGFDDTRGTLFFWIEKILKIKKPNAFLLENVKHLKGHNNGSTLKTILNILRKDYYVPDPQILNAKDFGLPQNRQRIYIIGFLKNNGLFEYPEPLKVTTSVGSILEKRVPKKYVISSKLWEGHQRRKREHKVKGNGFGYGIFNKDNEYTNTISARYYKDGSEVLISRGKNKNPRKLTERECARLQGFPENFKIPVSTNQAYKQFGNSVPVKVIEALGEQIIRYLKNYNISKYSQSESKKIYY